MTKINFKKLELQVEKEYPAKEYMGVYESYLHMKTQLAYLKSELGKKNLIKELGEMKYLEQVRIAKNAFELRRVEVEFMKNALK